MNKCFVVGILLLNIFVSACGGGDSGGSSSPRIAPPTNNGDGITVTLPDGTQTVYSHTYLANVFVKALQQENNRKGDPDYLIARASTFQKNFIIFKDYKTVTESTDMFNPACLSVNGGGPGCSPIWIPGPDVTRDVSTYFAVNLAGWVPGTSAMEFLKTDSSFEKVTFRDFDYYGNASGLKFEKMTVGPKNLAKIKAFHESYKIEAGAERLVEKYGLSADKAIEASRFAYRVSQAIPGTYKMSDFDSFSQEFVGSSISDFETDFRQGNVNSFRLRIQRASDLTGVGVEGVNRFIKDVFGSGN